MKRILMLTVAMGLMVSLAHAADDPSAPIRIQPHPGAGKFKAKHDPDKPILGFYGGIGLYQRPNGQWTGYGQRSEDSVRYLINRLAGSGITKAYVNFQEEDYPSEIGPSSPPGAPDYIKLFCELAHQNNIEVYGHIACFATNEISKCREFAAAHPEMFTRSIDGTPHPYMLSPAYPEVRWIKRALLMEYVQNYPVDGLALDFIRYPTYVIGYGNFGYDEPALKRFREQYGYDESYVPAVDDPRWLRLKADYVTQFIREVRADMEASGVSSLPVGAFNYSSHQSVSPYQLIHQDALTWEEEGLINEHMPMIVMTGGMSTLVKQTSELLRISRPDSTFLGPIFLAEWPTPEQGGTGDPTPEAVRDAARRLIKLGCDGLWFCRAEEIERFNLWPVVKEISQWSISQIRAEDFDPFYENLLADGS
ncbi:MAG TPA: family 10 glycosylhydrolase, partial [Phycisphaeraceae bacterium]